MKKTDILDEGHNCWRVVPCERAAFLIDGQAYFSTVAATIRRARKAVYIIGWDVDSRILLERGEKGLPDGLPAALGPFLNELVSRSKELNIYVLDWDFAILYALEREPLPIFKFGWRTHRRLHFKLDGKHPVGASHHQKVVVVDDRVAFCGGFDLASGRWDRPAHAVEDPLREDDGKSYRPFHDVQLMVDGEAAQALGELARERWQRATGEVLMAPGVKEDPWPEEVAADLERMRVGILRTEPTCNDREAVCEVKNFYLDAIAAARQSIYIENQYFTAYEVGEALKQRLAGDAGPEVVLVLPQQCSGWLEKGTMGVLQARLLQRLQQADRHGRLRVYYPTREGLGEEGINVHAKVLVVDDRLVRIGSSNLNNRSMGFDSECDLVIEANGEDRLRQGILAFRDRLLAEHLGAESAEVAKAIREQGTLRGAIEALNRRDRRLEPLAMKVEPWLDSLVPDSRLIDPEKPITLNEMAEMLAPSEVGRPESMWRDRKKLVFAALVVGAFGLAALWRWTPMANWLDVEAMATWGGFFRDSAAAPLIVVAVYLLGGFILVPVTLLILVTAMVFGPVVGFAYSLAGSLTSALATFVIGRLLGRERVRTMAGEKVNRISRYLTRRGLLTVTTVRIVPVAHFSLVNLVAGASRIQARDFFFGTLLGMTPGIIAISLFEEGLLNALKHPDWTNLLLLTLVVAAVLGGSWLLRCWLQRKGVGRDGGDDD